MQRLLLILLMVPFGQLNAYQEWINPNGKRVRTIYYQGMHCSQTQGAKYTGSHGFISPTTGEQIVCDESIDIIQDIWVKPEIDEVVPEPTNRNWKALLFNPHNLVANLWQYSQESASRLANQKNGIRVKQISAKTVGLTLAAHSLILSKINIAQGGDLANHARRVESFYQECPEDDAILMGASRGAATTFQAAVLYNRNNINLGAVRLIVLEGCFDSVEHVMKKRHPWLLQYDSCMNVLEKIASKVIAFKKDGTAPIKMVQDFPKYIPVVFITSAKDKLVSAECTKNLIRALIVATGHDNVYLLELENSSHPNYMKDDIKDKTNYQNFMHALFKRLDLPYILEFADAGKDLVERAKMNAQALK